MNLTRFLDWLQSLASSWTAAGAVVFVVGVLAVFGTIGSPWLERRMRGWKVLDVMLRPLRTPDEVTSALQAYGDSGRRWYLYYLVADAGFAVLYSLLLAVSAAFAANQVPFFRAHGYVAMAIPLVGGLIFDLGENLLLGFQTARFPEHRDAISWVALGFTIAKIGAFLASLGLFLFGLVVAAS